MSLTWTSVVLYHWATDMTVSNPVTTCVLQQAPSLKFNPTKGKTIWGGRDSFFFCYTHYQSSTSTSLQEKISCKLTMSPKWITKCFHVAHFFPSSFSLSLLQEIFTPLVLTNVTKGNHDHAHTAFLSHLQQFGHNKCLFSCCSLLSFFFLSLSLFCKKYSLL